MGVSNATAPHLQHLFVDKSDFVPAFLEQICASFEAKQHELLTNRTGELDGIQKGYENAIRFVATAMRSYGVLENDLIALGPEPQAPTSREYMRPLTPYEAQQVKMGQRRRRMEKERHTLRNGIDTEIAVISNLQGSWNTCWQKHGGAVGGALSQARRLLACYKEGLYSRHERAPLLVGVWTPPELALREEWYFDPDEHRERTFPPGILQHGDELAHAWLNFWQRDPQPLSLESGDDGTFELE
ncbi:hypothetical protein [Acrocarpospora corrugata]|nr:hypothetical protein [Acrocarpospora corrugata]